MTIETNYSHDYSIMTIIIIFIIFNIIIMKIIY